MDLISLNIGYNSELPSPSLRGDSNQVPGTPLAYACRICLFLVSTPKVDTAYKHRLQSPLIVNSEMKCAYKMITVQSKDSRGGKWHVGLLRFVATKLATLQMPSGRQLQLGCISPPHCTWKGPLCTLAALLQNLILE